MKFVGRIFRLVPWNYKKGYIFQTPSWLFRRNEEPFHRQHYHISEFKF